MAIKQLSDGNPEGTTLGQGATDLIAFYGNTPVVQRSTAAISGTVSTAAWVSCCSTKWAARSCTWFTKITATVNELKATICALGLHKGKA